MKNRPMTLQEIATRDAVRIMRRHPEVVCVLRGEMRASELTFQDAVNINTQAGYLRRGRALLRRAIRSPE